MSNQDLLKKYKAYRDNVQWHIDTNKPEGDELVVCQQQVKYYSEIVKDLESLSAGGMRGWVKASDRLPDILPDQSKPFVCRNTQDGEKKILWYGKSGQSFLASEPWNWEWLDESLIPLQEGEYVKEDEYRRLAEALDKPALNLMKRSGVTFDKWADNIHSLVQKELGLRKITVYERIPKDKSPAKK